VTAEPGAAALSAELRARIAAEFPKYPEKRAVLLTALHFVQAERGWIPPETIVPIAELLEIEPIEVQEVISFYSMFHADPVGRWHIQVCTNLPCCLRGARQVMRGLEQTLGIRAGEVTEDELFSLAEVECLGSCGTAPVVQVNNEPFVEGAVPDTVAGLVAELRGRGVAGGKRS
jgi:NADH-quinone oxidoreductase subunit E